MFLEDQSPYLRPDEDGSCSDKYAASAIYALPSQAQFENGMLPKEMLPVSTSHQEAGICA